MKGSSKSVGAAAEKQPDAGFRSRKVNIDMTGMKEMGVDVSHAPWRYYGGRAAPRLDRELDEEVDDDF